MAEEEKQIVWDDSDLTLTYANVCNVSSTREEFNLLFGANRSWNTDQKQITVKLDHRIVLNPHSAKRLAILLANAVEKYESDVGKIDLGISPGNPPVQ